MLILQLYIIHQRVSLFCAIFWICSFIDGKLNEIEESLKESKAAFLRVHQSFLVNYKHVDGIGYDFVVMDNGKRISISEDRRKQISEEYCAMEDTFYVGR